MKRAAIAFTLLFLVIGLLAPTSEATRAKKKKTTSAGKKVAIPCPETLNDIGDCLDTRLWTIARSEPEHAEEYQVA